jgi:hypothetical protein
MASGHNKKDKYDNRGISVETIYYQHYPLVSVSSVYGDILPLFYVDKQRIVFFS